MNQSESDSFNNVTVIDKHKEHPILYVTDILVPILSVVIILLNLTVVISSGLILKFSSSTNLPGYQQPKSTYMFLGNVALTDLVAGIAGVFAKAYPKSSRNQEICAVIVGIILSSSLSSLYSVGLIGVDRYLYIVHGMKYRKWIFPRRVRVLIFLTWLLGCAIGFLPLFGWHGNTNQGKTCWFILLAPKNLVILTVAVAILPLFVVITLYSIILYYAIRQNNSIRKFSGGPQIATIEGPTTPPALSEQASKTRKKYRAVKIVMLTTGSFVVTWCPYFITCLIYVIKCDKDSKNELCHRLTYLVASPLAILGFSNSLINPLIYAWWHRGFREFVASFIRRMIKRFRSDGKMKPRLDKSISNTSRTSSITPET